MIMTEEIKGLVMDITALENKRMDILEKREFARNTDSVNMYQGQADELEKIIDRRMRILEILVKD